MSAPTMQPTGYESRTERDKYFYGWRMVERERADGTKFWERVPLTEQDVLHPQEEDFIVQNEAHAYNCNYLKYIFEWRLESEAGALVLQDHRVDFQVPDLEPLGPDNVVLLNSKPWDPRRGTYPVRDMGATVLQVIEITSPSTRNVDMDEKVYEFGLARVPLYIIVDYRENGAGPQLHFMVYRSTPEGMIRVKTEDHRVWLPAPLNLWLTAEGERVVCLDKDGNPLGSYAEVAHQVVEAHARANAEAVRADELDRKLKEAEEELRRLRGQA